MLVLGSAMSAICSISRPAWSVGVLVFGLALPAANAQTRPVDSKPTVFDAYGNAASSGRQRRLVGSFTGGAQREASRGLQSVGRRVSRRGYGNTFALSSDASRFRRTAPAARLTPGFGATRPRSPSMSPAYRSRYSRYGGFHSRGTRRTPAQLSELLARPQSLTAATAMNAPVHRAQAERATGFGMGQTVARVPFLETPRDETSEREQTTLYEQLNAGIQRSHDQAREDGWRYFEEGAYRRAARSFEAAVMIEPEDFDSRAGVVVSYLALGAMRTSLTSLVALAAREANPFAHHLDLAGHFPDEMSARQLRLQTQLYSQAHPSAEVATALHAFFLWHLGARDDAMLAARPLDGSRGKGPFASWPSKMAAARAAATPDSD